ncbi:hypothetical protein SKAU_G00259000 [Synaphobranchus kaupii]|uniref:Uncharacterized protein n=1 Tax=Synaphobranchus kaupii TaxID=118154 RepID=A0A9Q1F4P8_SYNKA|nr:hypothetical protein SKAU_G00259000 [Synaphobranchus kaupii]
MGRWSNDWEPGRKEVSTWAELREQKWRLNEVTNAVQFQEALQMSQSNSWKSFIIGGNGKTSVNSNASPSSREALVWISVRLEFTEKSERVPVHSASETRLLR